MAETDNLDPKDVIEIRDEQIDAEAIMHTIRANIQKRREAAQAQGIDFDAFVQGLYSEGKGHFDAAVYYNLRRAATLYDRITVKQYVSPRKVPIAGGLMQRVRGALHDLVIYYVNMLGSKQTLYNESIVYALNGLVEGLEKNLAQQAEEMETLRREVDSLHKQLADLRGAEE
jgi:hypothetical protein